MVMEVFFENDLGTKSHNNGHQTLMEPGMSRRLRTVVPCSLVSVPGQGSGVPFSCVGSSLLDSESVDSSRSLLRSVGLG